MLHRTVEQLPPNDAGDDLDSTHGGSGAGFDLVVAGHNHDSEDETWKEAEVCDTGPAAPMSTNTDPTDGVGWLVTAR